MLFRDGAVTTNDGTVLTSSHMVGCRERDAIAHQDIRVCGEPLDPPPHAIIMLHKPEGVVCSTQERAPLVYDLLPARFAARSPVLATVGRLDRETTGLLLLTGDGQLLHRLTSPRSHVPKRYLATLAEPLRDDAESVFASGELLLRGETTPLRAAQLSRVEEQRAYVTVSEGRYHQVRRMFAAIGNHVTALHRDALGPLTLGDLASGGWRVLQHEERTLLEEAIQQARGNSETSAKRTDSASA